MTDISKEAIEAEARMMDKSSNHIWAKKIRSLAKERDTLAAENERLKAQAVTVKPLEWVGLDDNTFTAEDSLTRYRITRDTIEPDTGTWQFLIGSTWYHGSESLSEAIEEVAIERGKRILSAIETTSAITSQETDQ